METLTICIIYLVYHLIIYLIGTALLNSIAKQMPKIIEHNHINGYVACRTALQVPIIQTLMLGALIKDYRGMKFKLRMKRMNVDLKAKTQSFRDAGNEMDADLLDTLTKEIDQL